MKISFSGHLIHNSALFEQIIANSSAKRFSLRSWKWRTNSVQHLEVKLNFHVFSEPRRIVVSDSLRISKTFKNGIRFQQTISDISCFAGICRGQSQELQNLLRGFSLACTWFARDENDLIASASEEGNVLLLDPSAHPASIDMPDHW